MVFDECRSFRNKISQHESHPEGVDVKVVFCVSYLHDNFALPYTPKCIRNFILSNLRCFPSKDLLRPQIRWRKSNYNRGESRWHSATWNSPKTINMKQRGGVDGTMPPCLEIGSFKSVKTGSIVDGASASFNFSCHLCGFLFPECWTVSNKDAL